MSRAARLVLSAGLCTIRGDERGPRSLRGIGHDSYPDRATTRRGWAAMVLSTVPCGPRLVLEVQ